MKAPELPATIQERFSKGLPPSWLSTLYARVISIRGLGLDVSGSVVAMDNSLR